jgi:uncharacterized protein
MRDDDPTQANADVRLQPVRPGERIAALDILRGFALFGVLVAYAVWSLGNPPVDSYGAVDRILEAILSALVDTKFYTIFAFLFGLGFSIQLTRAEARSVSIVPVYCRRLLALLLIGLAHALLLRNGDILVPYAVMGFVLLPFRHASNRTLAVGAVVGLVFPYLVRSAWDWSGIPFPQRPELEGAGYLAENLAWVRYWYSTAIVFWPASLPMFLFGHFMGRKHFFDNLSARRKELRLAQFAGLGVGILAYTGLRRFTANVQSLDLFLPRLTSGLLASAHAWGLAACYASSLLLLLQRPLWGRWLSPLGAVGRMALTNYLLQAGTIVPICLRFDLFGKVTPTLGLLLALGLWAVQVPLSVWWLAHFRFGPAEWFWRSLTYGRLQPMRVAAEQFPHRDETR